MVKRILYSFFVLIIFQKTFAQAELKVSVKPDFKEIEKSIKDKKSPFYYEKLMSRYKNNDTTLTPQEYRYLYYGFSFQNTYSPYGKSNSNEDLRKAIDDNKTEKIIELEKKVLEEFPFNLGNLNTLINALDKKRETVEANLYYKKLLGIGKAILSTGDGLTDTTAMYVISVEHEYDLISLMGYKFGGSQSLVQSKYGAMDKMALKKNDEGIDNLFFNVDRLFASMEDLFKKKN